jgi:hypothetical protein
MHAGEFARRLARINFTQRRGAEFRRRATRALVKRAGARLFSAHGREVGYRMQDGSFACHKQRFRRQEAAFAELERIGIHASHAYIPVRAYQCEWCGGWHLTSRN